MFMAGIPGAGKTEIAHKIVKEVPIRPVHIEHDRLLEEIKGVDIDNYSPKTTTYTVALGTP